MECGERNSYAPQPLLLNSVVDIGLSLSVIAEDVHNYLIKQTDVKIIRDLLKVQR